MSFSCIIIDDEFHAIGLLAESLKGLYNDVEIVGTFSTWKDGLAAVRTMHADILFLDISIEGKNGMDMLEIVPTIDSEVIFVTAYAEHALDAFKYSASGYVLKPVGDAELNKAVNNALERVKNKRLARLHTGGVGAQINCKIGIPSGKGINYYNVDEIICFQAVNNYTRVVTKTSELTSSYNIGKFKSLLEGKPFFHVHRSYIVNLNFITRYEAQGIVIMTNKMEIPVARSSKDEFLKQFNRLQSNKE
jgi:two-component system LytT family response regulator